MNKRGLSAIITTLLVVLLVLVAVGIVWGVVRNIIREGAEEVSLGKFTLKAEITKASIDDASNNVTITVERNPGKGELTGIRFIFNDGTDSEVVTTTTTLQELGSETFVLHLADLDVDNLVTISIVPVFKSSSGKEILGNVLDTFEDTIGTSSGGNPPNPSTCGNNAIEGTEDCDGTDLAPYTLDCSTYPGFDGGTLACLSDCSGYDTSLCVSPPTQCNDGLDNDADGCIDISDADCINAADTTESGTDCSPPTQCNDGLDNDADGCIDISDADCINAADTTESGTDCSAGAGGLVLHYPLDGNANDISGNGLHGALYDSSIDCTVSGVIGQACKFDGVTPTKISIPLSQILNLTTKTVTWWSKLEGLKNYNVIFEDTEGQFVGFRSSGNIRINWFNSTLGDVAIEFSDVTPANGVWAHYALVYNVNGNNVNVSFYRNGSIFGSSVYSGGLTSTPTVALGARFYRSNIFNGTIDDLRIYDRVLSASEISSLAT